MPTNYLHDHPAFNDLISITADEKVIDPYLIEKDYWIMHVLFGLKQQAFEFDLKGGTSLSKGHRIIHRFSEDIDIYIKPDESLMVNETSEKKNAIKSRLEFYDHLASSIHIDGIIKVERDHEFDDTVKYRSGGIRLFYNSVIGKSDGIKEGILLEAGFDTITPNSPKTISSWAYDKASETNSIEFIDNRAVDIKCYHSGYTFVEKLQTVVTKYRQEIETGVQRQNLMRQYYDLAKLLGQQEVKEFIGTSEYEEHKLERFPKKDLEIPLQKSDALLLPDEKMEEFEKRYIATKALYYAGQPPFKELIDIIQKSIGRF
ncbi:nucleotidyl transferase AbiEii/AbiGii toxin family protein [Algoriphagus chordae]|nr:nucleotidyl transferase AbiEii/AbiGii toxin family protein [Algoriphagus chordae]